MAYLVLAIVLAAMAAFSGVGKLRREPRIVQVVHEVVGVPLQYFPFLAACEIAGAVGLVLGIWWPVLGMAAGVGLVVYFAGAVVSHLRVGDVKSSITRIYAWRQNAAARMRLLWGVCTKLCTNLRKRVPAGLVSQ